MARLWGHEILGTVDLPAPSPSPAPAWP
jgi:hypothetical protein